MTLTRRRLLALPPLLALVAAKCGMTETEPLPPVQPGNPDSVLSNPPEPPVVEW